MLYCGSTEVWTLPENRLSELAIGAQLLTDPLSITDASGLVKAFAGLEEFKEYGDVCVENDTVVFIPRKRGFVDKLAHQPWIHIGALATALPALAAAAIADKLTQRPQPNQMSDKERLAQTVFGGLRCPGIAKKYGIDLNPQLHIIHPAILVSGRTRNAFQRWQNLAADKGACVHIYAGQLRLADRATPGLFAYLVSDSSSPAEVTSRICAEGVGTDQIKEIAPLDLGKLK